jgi:hypothetical protein
LRGPREAAFFGNNDKGGEVEGVRRGDVVWFGRAKSIGATPTTSMTHIAIEESRD